MHQDSSGSPQLFETSMASENIPLFNSDIFLRDYESAADMHGDHQEQHEPRNTLRRNITFHHGFAFVVGCIIGAGIFISPSMVARRTPNLFLALLAWIMAGGLALLGALCYCEMVSIIQKTGASYIFVLDCYGKAAGFVVNWTNALIFAPCDACLLVVTLGLYVCAPFFDDHNSPQYLWSAKCVGILAMLIVVIINCIGAKISGVFQIIFVSIQMLVFATVISLGIYSAATTDSIQNLSPHIVFNNTFDGLREDFPSFGIALFNALYCFDGYVTVAFIAEEVVNPSVNIPLITFTAIPFITFVYVVINLACSAALTQAEIGFSNIVVSDLAYKVGGETLAYFIPFFVAISIVPALSAVFYNLPRLIMSSAREGQFPIIFSLIHRKHRTPILGVCYLAGVTIILTLIDLKLETLLQCCNIAIWFEYGLTVSTILVNRYRRPYIQRTYKTWITTPIIMTIVPAVLFIFALIEKPQSTFLIILMMMLSTPVYYICLHKRWLSFIPLDALCLWIMRTCSMVKCELNELN